MYEQFTTHLFHRYDCLSSGQHVEGVACARWGEHLDARTASHECHDELGPLQEIKRSTDNPIIVAGRGVYSKCSGPLARILKTIPLNAPVVRTGTRW